MKVPVGQVNKVDMYPATFREFLRMADPSTFDYVESISAPEHLPTVIFNKLATEYRRYQICGVKADVIQNRNAGYTEFKGAMAENAVLQALLPQIGSDKPYYWTSDGRAEIEFLIDVAGHVIPVEVKAEGNTTASMKLKTANIILSPVTATQRITAIGIYLFYKRDHASAYLSIFQPQTAFGKIDKTSGNGDNGITNRFHYLCIRKPNMQLKWKDLSLTPAKADRKNSSAACAMSN